MDVTKAKRNHKNRRACHCHIQSKFYDKDVETPYMFGLSQQSLQIQPQNEMTMNFTKYTYHVT